MSKPEAILASYVTFKELYSKGQYKNSYQILAEFIKYIIITENVYSFTLSEMKNQLKKVFGFDLPTAVIKTSVKGINHVTKNSLNDEYIVELGYLKASVDFKIFQENATSDSEYVSRALIEFTGEKFPARYIDEKALIQEFIAYLLEDSFEGQYHDIISEFILFNEHDEAIQSRIKSVREGSILYSGLNYNISETGSIKKPLTLYLDTEILFFLVGYNGDICKSLALDLMQLVKNANSKKQVIKLRFFSDVRKEIEDFFGAAEDIVAGRAIKRNNSAMTVITNGCTNSTDVVERKADFFSTLRSQYGIIEDENTSYYSEADYKANLEGIQLESDIPDDEDTKQALKYVSHINKIRKNTKYYEYTESDALFVTATYRVIQVSGRMTSLLKNTEDDERNPVEYAIWMDRLTNILWYKLNKGFGNKEYPKSLDVVIKAKTVLNKMISQEVSHCYSDLKKQYDNGTLTEEKMAARILALRKKAEKPDDLTANNIDENLNFDPEYIKRFEGTIAEKDELLREKEEVIGEIKKKAEFDKQQYESQMEQMRGVIANQSNVQIEQQKQIDEQQKKIEAQQEKIDDLIRKEDARNLKIALVKKSVIFGILVALYFAVTCAVFFGTRVLCNKMRWNYVNVISFGISIGSAIPVWFYVIKRAHKMIFEGN